MFIYTYICIDIDIDIDIDRYMCVYIYIYIYIVEMDEKYNELSFQWFACSILSKYQNIQINRKAFIIFIQ